jgi:Fe-S cluster biosynthesis and repair protein YggX
MICNRTRSSRLARVVAHGCRIGKSSTGKEAQQQEIDTMAERLVNCVKLGRELLGLERPPFKSELGQRIYENVSQQAWNMFREHLKMIINEYRLVLGTEESNRIIEQQMEQYFFGSGSNRPPGYVAPEKK